MREAGSCEYPCFQSVEGVYPVEPLLNMAEIRLNLIMLVHYSYPTPVYQLLSHS